MGLSPNQILWGGEPPLMTIEGQHVKNQTALDRLEMLKAR